MPSTKVKATLYLEGEHWQAFREACLHRHVSASQQLGTMILTQLSAWKETAHQEPTDSKRDRQ